MDSVSGNSGGVVAFFEGEIMGFASTGLEKKIISAAKISDVFRMIDFYIGALERR